MKLLVSAFITLSIVYTLYENEQARKDFLPVASDFDHLRWWTLPVYVVSLIGMSWFRATRWRYLLRSSAHLPLKRIVAVSWIGFAAILLMPFRMGEAVRPYMIRQPAPDDRGQPTESVSFSTAMGTVLAERIVDGLYLSIVLAIALVVVPHLEPLPEKVLGFPLVTVQQVRGAGFALVGIFSAAFVTIAIYYFWRGFARRLTVAIFGVVSASLGEKMALFGEKLADGMHFLRRGRDAWPFMLETTAYWVLNAFGMWILAYGMGVVHADGSSITLPEAAAIMGTLGIGVLIPGPPGFLGVFHLGVYAGMTMYFAPAVIEHQGKAYGFTLYVIQFAWQSLAAAIFLVGNRQNLKQLEAAEGIEVAPDAPDATGAPTQIEPSSPSQGAE